MKEPTVPMLAATMRQLQTLLRDAGSRWADELEGPIHEVERGDPWGARRFVGMHGGMGSLNDEPHSSEIDQVDERAYEIATALLRELEDRA